LNQATGAVVQRMDFDSWGNVSVDSNPGFTPFGYAGGLYENQTKLVRFGARDYDAIVSGWTGKDVLLFAGGDVNFFSFTSNDPINWTDAFGTQPQPVPPFTPPGLARQLAYRQFSRDIQHAIMTAMSNGGKEIGFTAVETATHCPIPRFGIGTGALGALTGALFMDMTNPSIIGEPTNPKA